MGKGSYTVFFKSNFKPLCLLLLELLRYEYKTIEKIGYFQPILKNVYFHLSPLTFSAMFFPKSQVFFKLGTKPQVNDLIRYGFKVINYISLFFLFK